MTRLDDYSCRTDAFGTWLDEVVALDAGLFALLIQLLLCERELIAS